MKLKDRLLKINMFVDNEYLNLYCDLITTNAATRREKFKTQKHHIIPKCYYVINKLQVDNSPDNIVNLRYKDHILAHYYLSLCTVQPYQYRMFISIQHILGSAVNKSHISHTELSNFVNQLDRYQELYEKSLIQRSERYKGRKLDEATVRKILDTKRKNHTFNHSAETKKKIGDSLRGKPKTVRHVMSEETKHKLSVLASKRIGKLNNRWGKHLSDKHKKILLDANRKCVECIESGKVYSSLSEASRETGAHVSKISSCCNGRRATTKGYHWRFVNGCK